MLFVLRSFLPALAVTGASVLTPFTSNLVEKQCRVKKRYCKHPLAFCLLSLLFACSFPPIVQAQTAKRSYSFHSTSLKANLIGTGGKQEVFRSSQNDQHHMALKHLWKFRWRKSVMVLSAIGYTVSGAGIAAINGNYAPITGTNATFSGAQQYTNGTYFLSFFSSGPPYYPAWQFASIANFSGQSGGTSYYYVSSGATTTTLPLTGWNTFTSGGGVAPAPTLAVSKFDITAPAPNTLSFSGTTGTLIWTEKDSPPVQNTPGIHASNPVIGIARNYRAGTDTNGHPFYTNDTGGDVIAWNAARGFWANGSSFADSQSSTFGQNGALASNQGQTLASGPNGNFQGLAGNNGTNFMVSSGFFPNQGLTITGLSGGAVTTSNVVTSGTTTTFTTSRAIAANETGGTFSGAAGAFSDSASPTNLTAAFSAPIVGSNAYFTRTPAPTGLTAVFTTR